jgi:hypothetical protein
MEVILFLLAAIAATAHAGSPVDAPERLENPATPGGWELRASPYGWLTGLDGTTPLVLRASKWTQVQ